MSIDQTVGLVAHLPLTAILKGERGVEFELVEVELQGGRHAAQMLYDLTNVDLSDDFATIAPASSPSAGDAPSAPSNAAVVEHDDRGDGAASVAPASDPPMPATIAGLKALVGEWEPDAIAEFNTRLTDAGVPKGHPKRDDYDYMANAIRRYTFTDVTTEPVERPPVAPPPPAARRTDPDEGEPLDDVDVAAAGKRYRKLADDVRSWVTVSGAKVRLSTDHGGKATRRRFDLLRGLCSLAEAGFDSDDMVRAVLAHIIDSDEAWQAPHSVADVIATLDAAEASRFAAAADAVAGRADVSLRYTDAGRAVLAASVVEGRAA